MIVIEELCSFCKKGYLVLEVSSDSLENFYCNSCFKYKTDNYLSLEERKMVTEEEINDYIEELFRGTD